MINVKKKERKKSVWIGEIFLPDLFRFCGQKRPESLNFFWGGTTKRTGKKCFEKERFYPEEDYMKTRTTFYTSSWHKEKRE